MTSTRLIKQFRVDHRNHFRLAFDPTDTGGLALDKQAANEMLARDIEHLAKLQERLYAQHQWALLVVLQGMDTAGKDGVIKHVMSGINPQGYKVHAFKAPSSEDLDHDFLWRARRSASQPAGISRFSTALIRKRSWWSASTRKC